MLDPAVTEEPIYFGAGGRLTGILTQPRSLRDESRALPRFVFLNAGLLHRVGPNRLYTFLARELASRGARVAISARRQDQLDKVSAGTMLTAVADVTDAASLAAAKSRRAVVKWSRSAEASSRIPAAYVRQEHRSSDAKFRQSPWISSASL